MIGSSASAAASAAGSELVAMMSTSFTESVIRRTEPADLDAVGGRVRPQRLEDLVASPRARARARRAAPAPSSSCSASTCLRFSSALMPKPRRARRRPSSTAARSASSESTPSSSYSLLRPLGAEAREVHHRDQADRDLRAQLDGRRDVAGLVQRQQLLLERLADVRQLGDAALAGERGDGHGGVAHGARGVAVGDHAVLDRAVELVEVRQLLEGGGDLGVGQVGHEVA